ncbi:MAG: hypothetical protein P4L53_11990 [Candidatus Obscuribacterales bacterium]|nr:hypothetical protein [Candidatus Obscuribacterales bacterium]
MSTNTNSKLIDFEIREYSLDAFKSIISSASNAPLFALDDKEQLKYFHSYLSDADIAAQSIVVEKQYVDRDYLADYSGYYVRCFAPYQRWCTRLHFFSSKLDITNFQELLKGVPLALNSRELQDSYLGFMVIKPLPETMIGRTCLKTYGMKNGRDYPNVRDYEVNLFGVKLRVRSLAFQEQDSVAAACASSAIWTAFQGTGLLFQHDIPSPLAITRLAIERSPTVSRAFPASDGLSDVQMAEAVRGVGLDPLTLLIPDNWTLAATTYAYLRSGIPIVWLGLVTEKLPIQVSLDAWLQSLGLVAPPTNPPEQINVLPNAPCRTGGHAITLVGYRLTENNSPKPHPVTGMILKSSRIDKIYVHDDNIGAFARVEFETLRFGLADSGNIAISDWISCKSAAGTSGRGYVTHKVLIPLFTTIRIPFHSIFSAMMSFDRNFEVLRANGKANFRQRVEWDIFLLSSNDYKNACLTEATLSPQNRMETLLTPMPRYVWLANAYEGGVRKFDFVFDSTDIEQGLKLVKIVPHDVTAFDELLQVSDVYSSDPSYAIERLSPNGKIWEHLRQLFEEKKATQSL